MCNQILGFQKHNILVIGDVMLDKYYTGMVTRISPEAPVPILNLQTEYAVLGGAANVAANLIGANQSVTVASVIGNDDPASYIICKMHELDINTDLIVIDNSRKTTVKTRLLGQNNQQMFRYDVEDKNALGKNMEDLFLEKVINKVPDYALIVISDYLKGVLTHKVTSEIISYAKSVNIKVIVDVKDKKFNKYAGSYLLKPNLNELHTLSNMSVETDEKISDAAKHLGEACSCEYVLVTRGGDGMTLYGSNTMFHASCASKAVFDVTGAGDTVIAYIGAGLASGLTVEESVEIANYAAGVKVQKIGTSPVSLEEVVKYIASDSRDDIKIVDENQIDIMLKKIKDKKIVFTNGCFDILHSGHISYLKQASALGDVLIIGINSDASIQRLKGDNRPIVNEDDRMILLSALEFVDYVIKFDGDTPLEIIKKIKPQVLVKGGDYSLSEIVGKKEVEDSGGEVITIPFVEGQSTTSIINKILDASNN